MVTPIQNFRIATFLVALSSSLVYCASVSRNAPLELIILHNNDMHSRFEQTSANSNTCSKDDITNNKCYGGFARVAYELKKFRGEANNGGVPVLYLNAGDTYTGTPWFTLYKDKIVSSFLNLLRPDAISLGNHELDNGVEGVVPFLNDAHFPVLAANLDLSNTPTMANATSFRKSTVFDVNGVKVGVIGYLTPETELLTPPNTIKFLDEIEAINSEAESLKNSGVSIIIALGHSGYDKDREIGIKCPLVDVVVGGHSHSFLYTGEFPDTETAIGPYPTTVTKDNGVKVPVVQAYAYTKYLGHLRLSGPGTLTIHQWFTAMYGAFYCRALLSTLMYIHITAEFIQSEFASESECHTFAFDANGNLLSFDGTPILLSGEVPRDADVLALLETYRPGVDAMKAEVVGVTKVTLDGDCRFRECNFGNLITDSMVYARSIQYAGANWTDAPIAFVNSGGIRTNVNIGNITRYDLLAVLPFDSRLMITSLTGKEIVTTLENTVWRYSDTIGRGEFFQYSGLHVVFNLTQPSGSRVQSVRVRCSNCSVPQYSELDENQTYSVIITSFLNEGGDGHTTFLNKTTIPMEINDLEAVISYTKAMKSVYPAVEWRITLNGKVQEVDENDDDKGNNSNAPSHAYSSFMLMASVVCLYFFESLY